MQVQPAATIVIAITGIQNTVFEMKLATLESLGAGGCSSRVDSSPRLEFYM